MRVTSRDVVDSHGSILRMDRRQLASFVQEEDEEKETELISASLMSSSSSSSSTFFGEHSGTYFNEIPIISLRTHVEKLIGETEYVEKLIKEAIEIMRQIHSAPPTLAPITHPIEEEERVGEATRLLERTHIERSRGGCSPCCALF